MTSGQFTFFEDRCAEVVDKGTFNISKQNSNSNLSFKKLSLQQSSNIKSEEGIPSTHNS